GVITGIERFEHRSSVKTWLYRILLNVARTKGAREHRTIPFSSVPGALDEGAGPTVDPERFLPEAGPGRGHWAAPPVAWDEKPEDGVLSRETSRLVRTAIEDLPGSQREVMTLRDLEGWTSTEVCNALDISETNQRVLLHRARSKVRRVLERHAVEPTS